MFVATYMAWISLHYSFLTFPSGPHSTASCRVSAGNLSSIVSQLEARTSLSVSVSPLAAAVLSLLSVPHCSADYSAGLALSLSRFT